VVQGVDITLMVVFKTVMETLDSFDPTVLCIWLF